MRRLMEFEFTVLEVRHFTGRFVKYLRRVGDVAITRGPQLSLETALEAKGDENNSQALMDIIKKVSTLIVNPNISAFNYKGVSQGQDPYESHFGFSRENPRI
jgi:hypothetical protein